MSDQTTGPGDSGDAGQPDYVSKYNGLQAAFQKRTNEFATREQGWQTEKAEYEAKIARLAEYEAKEQAAAEEAEAEAQYQALRDRFESPPPTPLRHNESRPPRGGGDDGSAASLKAKVAGGQMFTGTPTKLPAWPTK